MRWKRRTPRGSASLLAALVATLLGPPAAGETPPVPPEHPRLLTFDEPVFVAPEPEAYRLELPGGAVAFVAEDHTLPLVDVAVALRVGSFLDPPGKTGLASVTGALLRRAGAGEWPADEFDDRIARLGAQMDSFSGIARGGASLNVLEADLEEGIALMFAMLTRPRFDADRVEATRRNLMENMRRRNEDPLDILEREWEWLLWGNDHYSTRPLTEATLDAITTQDMAAFHRRYWQPENLVFAISGDVTRAEARRLLEPHLASWQRAPEATTPEWPPPRSTYRPVPGPYLIDKDVSQAKVRLGLLARLGEPWSDLETANLLVMNEILGGSGAISRIAGRLRTVEGLVYRASASFDTGDLWTGEFRVFFDAANDNVARAVKLSLAEIRRLRTDLADPRELEIVKETLLADLRQSFDSAEEIAGYLAEDHLLGRSRDYWHKRYEQIRGVTAEDVRTTAATHLQLDQLIVLAVGRTRLIGLGTESKPSELEQLTGRTSVRLPLRDPLSMAAPAAGEPHE